MNKIDAFYGNHRWLSNFAPARITHEGITYPTVEHAYQAAKTTDMRWRENIAACMTPRDARTAGQNVILRPDWEDVKIPIMEELLRLKFAIPEMRARLRATGDAELIEGNDWGDVFWGVCRGEGRNELGKALMRTRATLCDIAPTLTPQQQLDEACQQGTVEPADMPQEGLAPPPATPMPRIPETLTKNRRLPDPDGRLLLAGVGPDTEVDIMLLTTSVQDEQAKSFIEGKYEKLKDPARYSKGPAWGILKDILQGVDIDIHQCYFTALIKWLPPRGSKIDKQHVAEMLPILRDEVKRKKPKVIVTFGKHAFESVVHKRIKFADIQASWYWSEEHQCRVFVMPEFGWPVFKPEYVEVFAINCAELARTMRELKGGQAATLPVRHSVIRTAAELQEWVAARFADGSKVFSVDTEFGGTNHVDGKLRSLQIAWTESDAIYIRFMDDNLGYAFDVSYKEAGAILAPLLDRPEVQYVAHHISADLPWMHHWLGLEWYDKTLMDTEFAEQTLDENSELGAERLALRYTTLGRYDTDLVNWKAENPDKHSQELGYLLVPDEILIPYACLDVLVVMRAFPIITKRLLLDKTYDYYADYRNPMVGNLFTQFAIAGLPIHMERMESLRKLYTYCRDLLEKQFRAHLTQQAHGFLLDFLMDNMDASEATAIYAFARLEMRNGLDAVVAAGARHLDGAKLPRFRELLEHAVSAPEFNVRSGPAKIRWLFSVCGFTPIKSTKNLEKGMPSMAWEKVMRLPPERQKLFTPAADKQVLKMLADQTGDKLLNELLDYLAVSNVCNGTMKEATVDEDGNVTKEEGLFYWVAKGDGKLHNMYSCTETGRPRSWKPNILNLQSYVHAGVARAMGIVLKREHEAGRLPAEFEQYLDVKKIPSIRAVVDVELMEPAPGSKGWVLVESDFKAAELCALAFMAGDEAMIRMMTEPDPQFGILIDGDPEEDVVRLSYADDCGIPEGARRQDYIMSRVVEGRIIKTCSVDDLRKNADGTIQHPGHDLHWSLVEWVMGGPRETYAKKIFRTGVGKVGNFCIAEDELVATLRGEIPIQEVLDCDLLWDGVEWVKHEGVVFTGVKPVHYYEGLWATDNHIVWTETGKISFGEARAQQLRLVRASAPSGSTDADRSARVCGDDSQGQGIFPGADGVCFLSEADGEGFEKHGERLLSQMPLSEFSIQGPACEDVGGAIRGDATALLQEYSRFERELQRERNTGAIRVQAGLCNVGIGKVADGEFQEFGFRPPRQQWTLFPRELEAGTAICELPEQTNYAEDQHLTCACISRGTSGDNADREHHPRKAQDRVAERMAAGVSRVSKVYDIVNAGPRHKFTCSGVLVSNSSIYGATPGTLERKCEADTGKKPEPGTGDRILAALEKQRPQADAFLKMLAEVPKTVGYWQAQSGAKRRFVTHGGNVRGISERTHNSILSALSREARNFPEQNLVGDTATRACKWLQAVYRARGMTAYPLVMLYDSVVTLTTLENRFEVARMHEQYMYKSNWWSHHGRKWGIPISTELNYGWSWRPTKEQQKLLDDPAWHNAYPDNKSYT